MAQSDDELFGLQHVRAYQETDGERGYYWRGTTILLLTTVGRTTGETRTTPLIHRTDGDRWVVVASKGGAPKNPVWVNNLRADPAVEIRDLTVVQPMRVREVADEAERARLWALAVKAFPPYAEYQAKTTRKIPLFVAEPPH